MTVLSANLANNGTLQIHGFNNYVNSQAGCDLLLLTSGAASNLTLGGTSTLELHLDCVPGNYSSVWDTNMVDAGGDYITTSFATITYANFTGTPTGINVIYKNTAGNVVTPSSSTPARYIVLRLAGTVPAGTPKKLAFGQQPSSATSGASITPAVTVLVQDINGFTTTDTSNVTLALTTNPPPGGMLGGSTTVAAVNGVATFSNLKIVQVGAGYVLTATDGALTSAVSNSFNISGAASALVFGQQPPFDVGANVTFSPAVTVLVQDGNGNTVASDTSTVHLAILNNPNGGTLSGTTDRRGGKWRGDVQQSLDQQPRHRLYAEGDGWRADGRERAERQFQYHRPAGQAGVYDSAGQRHERSGLLHAAGGNVAGRQWEHGAWRGAECDGGDTE